MYKIVTMSLLLAGCAAAPVSPPPTNDPVTLRVNLFRGSHNIPVLMAIEKGYFSRRGITPILEYTPNSTLQREGLAAGRFDIAHAAVDNAVAMVEVAGHDVVIVAGGEGGMNELLVRPDISRLADLRGRTYVVDAPNTAYALIGRKILRMPGSRMARTTSSILWAIRKHGPSRWIHLRARRHCSIPHGISWPRNVAQRASA